jgi:hypothetical protein
MVSALFANVSGKYASWINQQVGRTQGREVVQGSWLALLKAEQQGKLRNVEHAEVLLYAVGRRLIAR